MDNKTFILNLDIKKDDIKKEHQNVLKTVQKDFETKGFRKGKAPIDVVEQGTSPEKIFEEVASRLISRHYGQQIKENNLKPIVQPQVKFKSENPDLDNDWQIEITSCELPEIKLDNKYLEEVKKINEDKKITDENQKIDKIIEVIVKNAKLDLPERFVESDTQHHLSHLVDQANQAGISVSQYLENKKQTIEQYQEELKNRIIKEWTINLSIQKIAVDNKLEVTDQEAQEFIKSNPQFGQNINLVYYFLTQKKVFDFLKK